MSELHKPQVAILASGEGTTAQAFMLATLIGKVDAEVPVVISDNQHPGVFKRVTVINRQHKLDIDKCYVGPKNYPLRRRLGEIAYKGHQTPAESEHICRILEKHGVDHVALMGYMRIVDGDLMDEYGYLPKKHTSKFEGRMSNTHRAPLPLTAGLYGPDLERKVLASGRKTSEHTVHLVSPELDSGPILARHRFVIEAGWSEVDLRREAKQVEQANLPEDIDLFLQQQTAYYGHP